MNNIPASGKKQTHILAPGSGATPLAVAQGVWGTKALDGVCDLDLRFTIEPPKTRGPLISTTAPPKYVDSLCFI